MITRSRQILLFTMVALVLATGCSRAPKPVIEVEYSEGAQVPQVIYINESIERFNRFVFAANDVVLRYVMNPVTAGWRLVVPRPVRKHIALAGDNLAFPQRLFGNMLQGKFGLAGQETMRFGVNTTVGLLGFFDPATRWGIERSDEDFGQTFGSWGMGQGFYLTMPMTGPSSGRELAAFPFDSLTDLKGLVNPVPGLGLFFTVNSLSDLILQYNALTSIEPDPYIMLRDLWALQRYAETIDYVPPPKAETENAPTLHSVFMVPKSRDFALSAKRPSVRIPTTGKKLTYDLWMQDEPAPILYIVPGAGAHRIGARTIALAELAYESGLSVVTISSTMNWEFMMNASSTQVPGFTPSDAEDLVNAMNAISKELEIKYGDRITRRALMGVSLGGLHALFIAARESERMSGDVVFDRYIAINPPADLRYALGQLDDYYLSVLDWPEEERDERIRQTLLKVVQLSGGNINPAEAKYLPFDEIETRFLIGLSFHHALRSMIYAIGLKGEQTVIPMDFKSGNKSELYRVIEGFTWESYMQKFAVPYHASRLDYKITPDILLDRANLRAVSEKLQDNPKVRVFLNEDDFILGPDDVSFFQSLFGENVKVFPEGGHLGNLHEPEIQERIKEQLRGL